MLLAWGRCSFMSSISQEKKKKKRGRFQNKAKVQTQEKIFCLFKLKFGSGACSCRHVQSPRSHDEGVRLSEKGVLDLSAWSEFSVKHLLFARKFSSSSDAFLAMRKKTTLLNFGVLIENIWTFAVKIFSLCMWTEYTGLCVQQQKL